jgi:diguanylate cyclase
MITKLAFLHAPPPHATGSKNYRLAVVVHCGALVAFGGHLFFIPLFLWLGVQFMAILNIASCTLFILCLVVNRRGAPHAALLLGGSEVVAHAILAVAFVGWNSGFHYYIIGLPILIFFSQSWQTWFKVLLVTILAGLYVSLFLYSQATAPLSVLVPEQIRVVGAVNMMTLFIVFSALAYYYRRAATDAEQALQRANLKLEHQAQRDPLTRLYNRRTILERIEAEIDRFQSAGRPFCIVLSDIDDFKVYNDRFGHDAGDLILVRVAESTQQCLRVHDSVARWGGEEFLFLLPDTRLEAARHVAERVRANLSATPWRIGETDNRLTMTFGIAEYAAHLAPADCIQEADRAMYEGKRRGKNCVMASSGR